MKAIIMAGGMGTRLRAVSGETPKPMVPMLGRPMMEHIVTLLRQNGFDDICAALRYRAGDIMAHFGDGSRFGVSMQYRIETEPLGTAGGVKNCEDFYAGDDFLVISGDAACDFELSRLMDEHKSRGAAVTLALCRNPNPLNYGLAVTDDNGRIRSFVEKPDWQHVVTDLVNTGIYAVSPRAMELVPKNGAFDFARDLFPRLLQADESLVGLTLDGYWCDIGTPADYYRCCADALSGKLRLELPESFVRTESEFSAESPERKGAGAIDCACRSRAELMGVLSGLFLDMGADYSNGITLARDNFTLHIAPLSRSSAVRINVSSDDAEFASELALSAKELIEALNL